MTVPITQKKVRPSVSFSARPVALGVAVCIALFGFSSSAYAQSCRSADAHSGGMLSYLKLLSSATDEQSGYLRRDLKIPVVDTATIVLVSTANVCTKVLQTFLAQLPSGFPTPLPTSLYVAKVGAVYVGMHHVPAPSVPPGTVSVDGSADVSVVVDSKYKFLAKYSH